MKLMGCAVMALTMIASAANAGDWRLTSAGPTGATAVDMSSVRMSNVRAVWTAVILPAQSGGMDYALLRREYNCERETISEVSIVTYKEDGEMQNNFPRNGSPTAIIPDSADSLMFEAVCFNKFTLTDQEGWTSVRSLLLDYRQTLN